MTTSTENTQTPPPQPAGTKQRLERSTNDRYVGGVCGGLGRYFDLDPILFRVGIGCLAVFGGGLILYAIGWALIPEEGQDHSVALATRYDAKARRTLLMIVIIGLAGLIGDAAFGPHNFGDGGWLTAIFLVGGVLWWRRESRRRATWPGYPPSGPQPERHPDAPPAPSLFWAATATAAPESFTPAPAAAQPPPPSWGVQPPAGSWGMPPPPASWGSQPPAAAWTYRPPTPKPPRERSVLGLLTISILLLAAGIAGFFDSGDSVDFSAQGYLAAGLAIVGGGLLIGAWYGRSRGLIALGLALTVVVSGVAAIGGPFTGRDGDVTWRPTSVDQLGAGFHVRAGSGVLDLRTVEFGPDPQNVDVSLGIGDLDILVPPGVSTRVTGHLGLGDVTFFGDKQEGVDIDIESAESNTPQLIIHLRLGAAGVKVRHEAS
ncbi:MAG: PspC domain-containing protein [Actinomycetota bacterium]